MNFRGVLLGLGVVGLVAGSLTAPAQAATKSQMRDALLTQAQIRTLIPDTGGQLGDREVTSTRAYYRMWQAFGEEPMSVTGLAITSLNDGRARPRDVPASFGSDFKRIRRTDDRLVQYRQEVAGNAVRVVIFRGVNAVSAECAQVSSGSEQPLLSIKELRTCARTVAKEQYEQLLRVVG